MLITPQYHLVTCRNPQKEGYLIAQNGIFLRAKREGLEFTLPLSAPLKYSLKGLIPLQPSISLEFGKVTIAQMEAIDSHFRDCYPNEAIAWIDVSGNLTFPELLETTPSSCLPKPSDLYSKVLVEIHSHGQHSPQFSFTDDEEQTGFRLYGIFSYQMGNPVIHFRLGYHQQFWTIYADSVGQMPPLFRDFAQIKMD